MSWEHFCSCLILTIFISHQTVCLLWVCVSSFAHHTYWIPSVSNRLLMIWTTPPCLLSPAPPPSALLFAPPGGETPGRGRRASTLLLWTALYLRHQRGGEGEAAGVQLGCRPGRAALVLQPAETQRSGGEGKHNINTEIASYSSCSDKILPLTKVTERLSLVPHLNLNLLCMCDHYRGFIPPILSIYNKTKIKDKIRCTSMIPDWENTCVAAAWNKTRHCT